MDGKTKKQKEKNMFTKSLAGTGVTYRIMQARRWNEDKLHIQIKGNSVNRPYGAAFDVIVPEEIIEAVESSNTSFPSLTGSGKKYFGIQAKMLSANRLHVQVAGKPPYNRGYGAAFDVEVPLELDPLF